jgi:hypothetical protein
MCVAEGDELAACAIKHGLLGIEHMEIHVPDGVVAVVDAVVNSSRFYSPPRAANQARKSRRLSTSAITIT